MSPPQTTNPKWWNYKTVNYFNVLYTGRHETENPKIWMIGFDEQFKQRLYEFQCYPINVCWVLTVQNLFICHMNVDCCCGNLNYYSKVHHPLLCTNSFHLMIECACFTVIIVSPMWLLKIFSEQRKAQLNW